MRQDLSPWPIAIACLAVACSSTDPTEGLPPANGAALWSYLQEQNHDTWSTWPGKGKLYEGSDPHGMLLTTYLNSIALDALNGDAAVMPAGAIIVKENYTPDSTLDAITTMYKVEGYDPEHNDWFWVKHLPDGTPAAEGKVQDCIGCHQVKASNDYIYTGVLRPE